MRQTVICEPIRTPIGRYGGIFKSQSAVDLGVAALKGLLERTGIAPEAVQDVILGHCYPTTATRPPSDVWWHWIPACRSRLRVCRSTAVAGRACRQ